MKYAALHRISIEKVDSLQGIESWILQKQLKIIKKVTVLDKKTITDLEQDLFNLVNKSSSWNAQKVKNESRKKSEFF